MKVNKKIFRTEKMFEKEKRMKRKNGRKKDGKERMFENLTKYDTKTWYKSSAKQ